MQIQTKLRKHYDADLISTAATLLEIRKRAASKFRNAHAMWFDRQGFEQSTTETIAQHKAKRFEGKVLDLCCGIGGDSIALTLANSNTASSNKPRSVLAVDINPAKLLMTQWNVEQLGNADAWSGRSLDVTQLDELDMLDALIHIDPDQRGGKKGRSRRVEDLSPSLEFLQSLVANQKGGAIKLSPASNFGGKFLNTEAELISLNGECKEATIWFGDLAGEQEWRATVITSPILQSELAPNVSVATIAGDPLSAWSNVSDIGNWIYDPDPAVVRSGLLDVVAEKFDLTRLDEAEEYLTSEQKVDSPFVTTFEVIEVLPGNEKLVRKHFRSNNYSQVEIKCRHVPIQADALRKRLPLGDGEPITLIVARIAGKTKHVVCKRVYSTASRN